MLDRIEERGLRPVNVLEDDDERRFGGQVLEEPPDRPEDFLASRYHLEQPNRRCEWLRDRVALVT